MCGQYKGAPTSEHFGKLPNLCAIDGTLLKALPRMAWALYQSDESTAVIVIAKNHFRIEQMDAVFSGD
jgi:hypothetical protein